MGGFLDYFRDEFSDPMYDPFKKAGGAAWDAADWFFNSSPLKPVSDYLRDDERKKLARAVVPGYSGLEAVTGGISGLGSLVGMGMDNGPMDTIPDWESILRRESGEGIHAGIESVAPVDIATAGIGGLSAFKPLKALKPISEGLNTGEALFGGGQVAHGLGTGNLPEAGMGLVRAAGGLAGGLSPHLNRPINLETTGVGNRGELPNFVSAMSESGGDNPGFLDFLKDDPLLKRRDEIKEAGVLYNPTKRVPKTETLYHGTGDVNWALGDNSVPINQNEINRYLRIYDSIGGSRPDLDANGVAKLASETMDLEPSIPAPIPPNPVFSSRKASSENLHGGPFYFTEEPAIAEGSYSLAGEGKGSKPGTIQADVTTNKTLNLEGPVPRDFQIRGRALIADAARKAANPTQEATFNKLYDRFVGAKTAKEAHTVLGDVLSRTDPAAFSGMGGHDLPLFDRPELSGNDLVNKRLDKELGYDSLKHMSHLGHEVTIPFSRTQIKTRDVIPMKPLGEWDVDTLLREYGKLDPSTNSAHGPLYGELKRELDTRYTDMQLAGARPGGNPTLDTSKAEYLKFLQEKFDAADAELARTSAATERFYDLTRETSNLQEQMKAVERFTDHKDFDKLDAFRKSGEVGPDPIPPELTPEEMELALPGSTKLLDRFNELEAKKEAVGIINLPAKELIEYQNLRDIADQLKGQSRLTPSTISQYRKVQTTPAPVSVPTPAPAPAPQTGGVPSKPTLSPNADTLKTILKSSGLTKFTPESIVKSFEGAGIPVPESMRTQIPGILGELIDSGWVNRKSTGTYTLNSTPTRTSIPASPMGRVDNLETQLKASLEGGSKPVSPAIEPEVIQPKGREGQLEVLQGEIDRAKATLADEGFEIPLTQEDIRLLETDPRLKKIHDDMIGLIDSRDSLEFSTPQVGRAESLENPSLRVSSPTDPGPKPIQVGDWVDELARDLGYTDLPGGNLTSKMVGDPKGRGSKPVEPMDPEAARNKLAQQLQEIRDQIEDKKLREAGEKKTQTGPSIRKPPSKRGEVVDPATVGEEGGKPKLYTVTLNDGTSHPVKAKSGEEAVAKAEEILGAKGSKKLVTGVKERISSLERAAESEVNEPEIKGITDITQAQAAEMIKKQRQVETLTTKAEAAHVAKERGVETQADKERIAILDKIAKAQDSEVLKLQNENLRNFDRKKKLIERAHAAELRDQIKVENDYKDHLDRLKKREEKLKLKSSTSPTTESLGWDILNLPKTLKSSIDISYPLRQGLFLINRKSGAKAIWKGLKSGKESYHLATKENLGNRANAELYKKSGLNQIAYDPTTDIQAMSEQFPSKFAEKIPGIKQSQRIYNDQANLMRADVFDEMVGKWSKLGKTPEKNPELYTGLAKYLNVLTGRDRLPDSLAQAGKIANAAFWSPQFVKSRLQILNPKFYWDLPGPVQKMAIRDVAGTLGTLTTVLGTTAAIAKSQGLDVDVESDTNHTNFGKLRVGDNLYDFFSGLLPIIRMTSRIVSSRQVTDKGSYNLKGGLRPPDPKLKAAPFGRSAATELGGFIEGKTSPAYQIGKGLLSGEDYYGGEYNLDDFLSDMALPMGFEDIKEGGAAGLPSLLGVGYSNRKTRERSLAAEGIFPKGKKKSSGSSKHAW